LWGSITGCSPVSLVTHHILVVVHVQPDFPGPVIKEAKAVLCRTDGDAVQGFLDIALVAAKI